MRLQRTPALLLALVLAGCNSGDNPTVKAGGATETTVPSSTATTAQAVAPPPTGAPATLPVSAPAPAERAYLTGVRAAATADGGSRVVFEFAPVVPGYEIDYVERPVTEDGSGDVVEVEGVALLQVRMVNAASARLDGEKVVRTYTGPERVTATGSGGVVVEAVDTGDFEGQVTWTVGLRHKAPAIAVSTLSGPGRLVIDVPAPG